MNETQAPGEPEIEPARIRRWPSPVWLVPLLAVLGAVALMVQNLASRGPLIEIEFATASGLKAGETVIKYRDVDVGRVEAVRFSANLRTVVAEARMDASIAPYLDDSARFWVVRPQVSAQGITGLDTVLTGSYIEASWDTEPGETRGRFTAEETPPLTPEGAAGVRIRLRAEDGGSLDVGSPIFYKRVEVGRIESKSLTPDGNAVEFDAFITAPNDRRITTATKFWNASGVDLELGADGARLRIASLSSLIRGGASFDTGPGGRPVEPGFVFTLFPSEGDALDVLDADLSSGEQAVFHIFFGGSVRGLRPGAAVEYRGIRIGRVAAVSAAVDPETNRFRTRTRVEISPSLLGLGEGGAEAATRFMRRAVADGLRAKLALGSLLTGALYVELDEAPATAPAVLDETGPVPILPAIASDLDELAGSVEGVLDRVNALPVEALMANAVTLLENLNRIVGDESTAQVPARTLALLSAAEALVASPDLQRATVDAGAAVAALRRLAEDPALAAAPERMEEALSSLAGILAALEVADTGENVAASAAALRAVLEDPAFRRLPASLDTALVAAAALMESPGAADLPAEINRTLVAVRRTLDAPDLVALPGQAGAALASLRARLDDPALAQAVADLGPLVAETRAAVAGIGPVLAAAQAILDDPETRAAPGAARAALEAARSLLEDEGVRAAGGEAARTLAALRKLLEGPGAQAAPAEVSATLAAARALLESLIEAEAAENLSRTLAATRTLAEDPALIRAADAFSGAFVALQTLLAAPGAEALPAATTEALTEAAALIRQFRDENLGGAAVAALSGVTRATQAVERASAGMPQLLLRLTDLSVRADGLLQSVSVGSTLNYEAVNAIREIRDAARAVTELADQAQRQPNSFIFGK